MIKFRLYFNKDAEIDWLNEMSEKGWAVKSFFMGFFSFEECEKGKYLYQMDFNSKCGTSREYREFMREADIEIVQSWFFWTILRRPASEGEFQLYTDLESSIAHYSKIRMLFKIAAIVEVICMCIVLMMTGIENQLYMGIPVALLLAVIFVVFLRMAIHTTDIIDKLKEKQTGIPVKRRRNISFLLAAGMLVNAIALLLNSEAPGIVSHVLQIVAIVLMLAGIWDTARKREK